MQVKIYEYEKCSTCQKALKFLDKKGVAYERHSIVLSPPSLADLKRMLAFVKADGGTFRNLFNTSGVLYREMQIAEKIKEGLSEGDALKLLSENGKLIKRPFLFAYNNGTVGFKSEIWNKLLHTKGR